MSDNSFIIIIALFVFCFIGYTIFNEVQEFKKEKESKCKIDAEMLEKINREFSRKSYIETQKDNENNNEIDPEDIYYLPFQIFGYDKENRSKSKQTKKQKDRWLCLYCDGLNESKMLSCTHCGAPQKK